MKDEHISVKELEAQIGKVLPEVKELRRALHRIPEAQFAEEKTAALIREKLQFLPVELYSPFLGTDVSGNLPGASGTDGGSVPGIRNRAGRTVLLRSDIDALPITESGDRQWKSCHPGHAHSCGHDGHMAMLFGALKVLSGYTDRFRGNVRFVFQPAEEERTGGKLLIEKGFLDAGPMPDAAFALHGWPGYPAGLLISGAGTAMAAADRFEITIRGKGGHGAMPHHTVDPVFTGAQVVLALQSIVSRNIDPAVPAVVTVGSFHAGEADNVIPETARMSGTVRYFEPDLGDFIRRRMEEIIGGVCGAAGADFDFTYIPGYIPLRNSAEMTEIAGKAAEEYLGTGSWRNALDPTMGAEDFAFYLEKVPGALVRLGLGEDSPPLHHPSFDFNDNVLHKGIMFFCGAALRFLGQPS